MGLTALGPSERVPKGQVLFLFQALGAKPWQVKIGQKAPFFL